MTHFRTLLLCIGLMGGSCATVIESVADPVALQATTSPSPSLVELIVEGELWPKNGVLKPNRLPSGSWTELGSIPQGAVFQSNDGILQLDTGHRYECCLVVDRANVVGFYLPVEEVFVPVREPSFVEIRPSPQNNN
jgi:hypothetical protein